MGSNIRKIKYLIKFVEKEEYADGMMQGVLYMNSIDYFRCGDKGQCNGIYDLVEAFLSIGMAGGVNYPCFCMYAAYEDECDDRGIRINSMFLKKLGARFKWCVVIEASKFESLITDKNCPKVEECTYLSASSFDYGLITYKDINQMDEVERIDRFFSGDFRHLFQKQHKFQYQQEYRIVVFKSCKKSLRNEYIERTEEDGVCVEKYEARKFNMPSMHGIAVKIKLEEKLFSNEDFYVRI